MQIAYHSMRDDVRQKLGETTSDLGLYMKTSLQRMFDKLETDTDERHILEQQVQEYFDQIKDTRKILEQRKIKELPKK